jgi:uncharacterized delta-60 repeat protein
MAQQRNGKIIVAGTVLARINLTGVWETVFNYPNRSESRALALQSDDKILVAGGGSLVRYNTNGALDTGFGSGGSVASGLTPARGVAVQTNGGILLLAGTVLASYTATGSLDIDFASGGQASLPITPYSLAVQSDGRILVAGEVSNATDRDFAVVRFKDDGTMDDEFGSSGIAVAPVVDYSDDFARSIALQADGKVVVAGNSNTGYGYRFSVVRFNNDGSLDTGFGSGGKVSTAVGGYNDYGRGVAIQDDGKILVAGSAHVGPGTATDLALVRYNADGSLDTGFGSGGKVTTNTTHVGDYGRVEDNNDVGFSVMVQADGSILVAGTADDPNSIPTEGGWGPDSLLVVRFLGGNVSKAELAKPVPGSILTSNSTTFSWNPAADADAYWLYVGSSPGSYDYHNSGQLFTSSLGRRVNGLPVNGSKVYARLYTKQGDIWVYTDYTYTAVTGTKAVIISPTSGSRLKSSSVTFSWRRGTGSGGYRLYVGSSIGARDYYDSGRLSASARSRRVSRLPATPGRVYVRLYTRLGARWVYNDYRYKGWNGAR